MPAPTGYIASECARASQKTRKRHHVLKVNPARSASDRHSIQLSTVEILPSAFPLDATKQFSNALLPYIRQLLDDPKFENARAADPETVDALHRATLVRDGELETKHRWVMELMEKSSKRQRAVVLGAG